MRAWEDAGGTERRLWFVPEFTYRCSDSAVTLIADIGTGFARTIRSDSVLGFSILILFSNISLRQSSIVFFNFSIRKGFLNTLTPSIDLS
jgi:hypothetical protein